MKPKRMSAALCAVLAAGAIAPQSARAQAPAPALQAPATAAPTAMTPEQSAAALAGAHEALLAFARAKTFPAMVDHLTDRSAGTLGIVFTIPIAFVIGFSQLGDTKEHPSPDPNLQKDFDAFIAKYLGDPKKTMALAGLPEELKGHEREFIAGLMEFETREEKLSKDGGKDDGVKISQAVPPDLQKYRFDVISPTSVKITPIKGNKLDLPGVVSFTAMQESGQWRIDFGDPAIILKAMQDSTKSGSASDSTPKDPLADKMIEAVKAHDIETIKKLLHKNPKLVDAQDFMGESALYNTVFWEDIPTATFLIAHGAKVNVQNHFGKTALDEAVFFKRDKMIALLKKHGAKLGPKKKSDTEKEKR